MAGSSVMNPKEFQMDDDCFAVVTLEPERKGVGLMIDAKKKKHKKYHRKQTLLFVFSVALPPSVGHDPHGGRSTGNVAKKTVGFMKRSS